MGDEGCKLLVESGMLQQLRVLDLQYGCITNKGAKMLAERPDLKHLRPLAVDGNASTSKGIAMLKKTGLTVSATEQQTSEQLEQGWYLFQGDFE